jgi:predicted dithiol-disulfide oxidoreductase (DUF899 family)
MCPNKVVVRAEWLLAREAHLRKEKAFDKQRDALTRERSELPWVRIEEAYQFDDIDGSVSLSDLFQQRNQLVVYHFMFHPDWEEGCPSCSFWADTFDRIINHLNQRDVSMVAVSRAPIEKIEAFRQRMGWSFRWLSSNGNDFNQDFHVSFTPEQIDSGDMTYNYKKGNFSGPEAPGVSVFFKDDKSVVYHTYSTYARGLDKLNAAYHYLDIVPKGRDEDDLPYTQAWVRHHDRYESR